MDNAKKLFFLAVLPHEELREEVKRLKMIFRDRFGSEHALNAPAHLTMIPPFYWPLSGIDGLTENLECFAGREFPFEVRLENFGSFPPRVIYIDVVRNQNLEGLHKRLHHYLDEKCGIGERLKTGKPFNPHLTLAFRDLTRENFRRAWEEFRKETFSSIFLVDKLFLLIHEKKQWNICHQAIFRKK